MKFNNYHINDFLLDEAFINWVKTGRNYDELQNWMLESPENIEKVNKAKVLTQSISFKDLTFSDREKNLLLASIEQGTKRAYLKPEKGGSKFWRINQIAAAVLLSIVSGVFLYQNLNSDVSGNNENIAENNFPELTEKFSPIGVKTTLELKDGTIVKLNSDSKLIFPSSFDANIREVYLEGEAFFDVSRDENRPFIIHTGKVKTTVLGTSFNIKAFPEDESVQVAVASGKVAVAYQAPDNNVKSTKELFLLPEEMSTFSKIDNQLVKSDFDRKQVLSWKDNILYFENASFNEVKEKLERWYGVSFEVKGKSLESEFEGEFHNESLKAVLEGLSFSVKFDFLIEDKVVTITNN